MTETCDRARVGDPVRARLRPFALLDTSVVDAKSILTGLLLLATCCFFVRFSAEMLRTSLWNDEIYSILNYSSRGPVTTLTTYIPNNHILYNLILSVIPGASSFDPFRARLPSHIAITLLALILLSYFARRRQFAIGVLALQPLLGNYEFLDLCLQARGYGLAALLCGAGAMCFVSIWEVPASKRLVWFALVNALGIATVPTFAFWSMTTYVLLVSRHRSLRPLISCAGSAALTLVIHVAVLPHMLDQALGGYGLRWGEQFASVSAVYDSIRLYFVGSAEATDARLTWGLLILLFLVERVRSYAARCPEIPLLASILAAYALCLTIKTPLVRTTSFLAAALAVSVCGVFAVFLTAVPISFRSRKGIVALLMLLFIVRDIRKLYIFHFVPIEAWKETARLIERTFPDGMSVLVTVAPDYLAGYLPGRHLSRLDSRSGVPGENQVIADTPMLSSDGRFSIIESAKRRTAVLFVPQRREYYQALIFQVPKSQHARLSDAHSMWALVDGDLETCISTPAQGMLVAVDLDESESTRSVVIATSGPLLSGVTDEAVSLERTESSVTCQPVKVVMRGSLAIVDVRDCRMRSMTLRIKRAGAAAGAGVCEVWGYPSALNRAKAAK